MTAYLCFLCINLQQPYELDTHYFHLEGEAQKFEYFA